MFVDFFQIYVVHISGKCIYESKKRTKRYLLMSLQAKSLSSFLSSPYRHKKNISHCSVFLALIRLLLVGLGFYQIKENTLQYNAIQNLFPLAEKGA